MDTVQIDSDQLPLYTKSDLPDDGTIIVLTQEKNYDQGGYIQLAYRLPLDRILPAGVTNATTTTLVSLNAGITVPNKQIVPAYVESFSPYVIKRAQASSQTTKAQFLIVAVDPNVDYGYVIQNAGYVHFKDGHNYDVGQRYYLSDTVVGGVTKTPPTNLSQPLFIPLDLTTIQIQLGA